jgi:hypothetical protein
VVLYQAELHSDKRKRLIEDPLCRRKAGWRHGLRSGELTDDKRRAC